MKPEVDLVYVGNGTILKNWFLRGEKGVIHFKVNNLDYKNFLVELRSYDDEEFKIILYSSTTKNSKDIKIKLDTKKIPIGLYQLIVKIDNKEFNGVKESSPLNFERYPWLIAVLEPFEKVTQISNGLPSEIVPLGIGVNIHFIHPRSVDLEMMKLAGISIVRMDLTWSFIEKEPGKYDLNGYIDLAKKLRINGIIPLFILDYTNPFYNNGLPPKSEEGRKAFAQYSCYSAIILKEYGVIFEVWNEPNIKTFWKPEPDVKSYAELLKTTTDELLKADKEVTVIAPACSGLCLDFIEYLAKNGYLKKLAAISVHPYRAKPPETVQADYGKLRDLLKKYNILKPIVDSEWGYPTGSSKGFFVDIRTQAAYIVRMYLINLIEHIPITIIYDWKDDGADAEYNEHNFGIIADYDSLNRKYGQPTYFIKPAYFAIYNINRLLNGFRLVKVLENGENKDYVLLFKNEKNEEKIVVWTTGKPHKLSLDVHWNAVILTRLFGKRDKIKILDNKIIVNISEEPLILERAVN